MWRIGLVSDAPADEIVCISDQFCYISHLSAMQRYGITDRRPEALSITQMNRKLAKELLAEKTKGDFRKLKETEVENVYVPKAYVTHHPTRARRRPIHTSTTSNYGEWRAIKGTHVRVSAIGQTFADMLSEPDLCGGMFHVLGCWDRHAKVYFEEIVSNLDINAHDIQKVRAGYILEERLGIADRRVLAWKAFAQRGGSRVLDPGAPFESKYSKDWMISLNVG